MAAPPSGTTDSATGRYTIMRGSTHDLDGVITRKDSFTGFLLERMRGSALRVLVGLPAVCLMLLSTRSGRRTRVIHRLTEISLSGWDEKSYAACAMAFGDRIGGDSSWIRDETVRRVRRQHAEGTRIVIATSTERRLAEALLTRAGIPFDLLAASLLAEAHGGMTVDDHRVGARKAQALRDLGVRLEEAEFVTDSITDLSTARASARVVLIGAPKRTKDRFVREGGHAVWEPSPGPRRRPWGSGAGIRAGL